MLFLELPDITSQIIKDLIQDHKNNKLPRYKKLQEYYEAKHEILNRQMDDPAKPNNKLVNDYPGYIIDTIQGYFIGKPVRYTSNSGNKEYLKKLNEIFEASNESDHNAEIAKKMGICGEAFELIYVNESGEVRFVQIPNDEIIVVFEPNFQKSIQLALRYYILTDMVSNKSITKVELYLPDKTQYYTQSGDNYSLDKEVPHFFGKVPVVYYHNNDECMGDFEKVLSLVDDYDKRFSDNSNELEYFRNAYLKIKNMTGTEPEDIAKCKQMGAFLIQGDGDVGFVEKNINDSVTEHHVDRLDNNIHKFSKVPNLSDESFAGNLSGVAIKYKLWPIEQIASNKERKYKTGLKRRIRLITTILNLKGSSYDWRDIEPVLSRNIPANTLEAAQTASTIKGIVSDETLLSLLPFIDSPAEELEKIKKEQEDSLNYEVFSDKNQGDGSQKDKNNAQGV